MKRVLSASPLIAALTDFGVHDAYVGIMKGVIAGISPGATVVDLSHEVPPQDVGAGAFLLWSAYRYFPAGTVFLCVVDPGVGTTRRIVAVQAGEWRFVGPDNGVLRWAVEAAGVRECVAVEAAAYRLSEVSRTFHGRDIMAPAAAHLANGLSLQSLGPPLAAAALQGQRWPEPQRQGQEWHGQVIYVDHFGNCITTIPARTAAAALAGAAAVRVARTTVRAVQTYGEGAPGEILALVGSTGLLEIAVSGGNARERLGLGIGDPVIVHPVGDSLAGGGPAGGGPAGASLAGGGTAAVGPAGA